MLLKALLLVFFSRRSRLLAADCLFLLRLWNKRWRSTRSPSYPVREVIPHRAFGAMLFGDRFSLGVPLGRVNYLILRRSVIGISRLGDDDNRVSSRGFPSLLFSSGFLIFSSVPDSTRASEIENFFAELWEYLDQHVASECPIFPHLGQRVSLCGLEAQRLAPSPGFRQ